MTVAVYRGCKSTTTHTYAYTHAQSATMDFVILKEVGTLENEVGLGNDLGFVINAEATRRRGFRVKVPAKRPVETCGRAGDYMDFVLIRCTRKCNVNVHSLLHVVLFN